MDWGQVAFSLTLVAPAIVGFVVGRRVVLLVLAAVWGGVAVFLEVNNGWHGAGWGDFGVEMTVLWAAFTFLLTGMGIGGRKLRDRERDRAAA